MHKFLCLTIPKQFENYYQTNLFVKVYNEYRIQGITSNFSGNFINSDYTQLISQVIRQLVLNGPIILFWLLNSRCEKLMCLRILFSAFKINLQKSPFQKMCLFSNLPHIDKIFLFIQTKRIKCSYLRKYTGMVKDGKCQTSFRFGRFLSIFKGQTYLFIYLVKNYYIINKMLQAQQHGFRFLQE